MDLSASFSSTEAALSSAAHVAILDTEMLHAHEVSRILNLTCDHCIHTTADCCPISNLRRSSVIVGLERDGFLYPAFQFDVSNSRVWPIVVVVNKLMDAAIDPWAVASWWISENTRLGCLTPVDLVGTAEQDDLIVLATS